MKDNIGVGFVLIVISLLIVMVCSSATSNAKSKACNKSIPDSIVTGIVKNVNVITPAISLVGTIFTATVNDKFTTFVESTPDGLCIDKINVITYKWRTCRDHRKVIQKVECPK